MGWSSGDSIYADLWMTVEKFIPHDEKRAIAEKWIDSLRSNDGDAGDMPGMLGLVATHERATGDGAPANASEGDTHRSRWAVYVFRDGFWRWQSAT